MPKVAIGLRRLVGVVKRGVARARRLPPRQLGAAGLAVGLAALTLFTLALGHPSVSIGLLACLVAASMISVLLVRRRLLREVRTATQRIEAAHRRVLAAVEDERLTASDRYRALLESVTRTVGWPGSRNPDSMPLLGRWDLDPTEFLDFIGLVERERPKLVLEIGSGASSLWLASALARTGGRLVTMEFDQAVVERVRKLIDVHELGHVAEVLLIEPNPPAVESVCQVANVEMFYIPDSQRLLNGFPLLRAIEANTAPTAVVVVRRDVGAEGRETVRVWTDGAAGVLDEAGNFGTWELFTFSRDDAHSHD